MPAVIGCNPITGRDENYYCEKCQKYGETKYNYSGEEMRTIPCTVCAMQFGGTWVGCGNMNGTLPGICSVESLISENPEDVMDGEESQALDHQVILGFVQFALYNHLKWSDILDLEEGKSKDRPKCPPEEYRQPHDYEEIHQYSKNWYWWKIIPHGTKLPKRLVKILKEILQGFTMMEITCSNSRVYLPKNIQLKYNYVLEDYEPSWEDDFWNTYVEPQHVAFIFAQCTKEILKRFTDENTEFTRLNLGNIGEEDIILHDLQDPNLKAPWQLIQAMEWRDQFMDSRLTERYQAQCFTFMGEYLNITDRHVFGCSIQDVINYDSEFRDITNITRNSFIQTVAEAEAGVEWRSRLWNTNFVAHNNSEMYAFWKLPHYYLVFNDRHNWTPRNIEGVLTDWELEYEFTYRPEDFDHLNSGGATFTDEEYDINDYIEFESEDEEDDSNKEKKDKLKEIMELIEDLKEKEKMNEGEYLEISGKMKEMYELL